MVEYRHHGCFKIAECNREARSMAVSDISLVHALYPKKFSCCRRELVSPLYIKHLLCAEAGREHDQLEEERPEEEQPRQDPQTVPMIIEGLTQPDSQMVPINAEGLSQPDPIPPPPSTSPPLSSSNQVSILVSHISAGAR